jgi:hypothetical protein
MPRGEDARSLFSTRFLFFKGGKMESLFVSDKRKTPRFQVSIPVRQIQHNNSNINSHTFDISSTGIGLIMDAELPLGQSMGFDLWMPDTGEQIHVQGKAIWMTVAGPSRFRVGIEIEEKPLKPIPLVLRTIRLRSHHYG